jgi:site-specific recombinase XerD
MTLILSQAIERYLLARRREIAETTYNKYRYALKLLLESTGDVPLTDISEHHLVLFRESLFERDYKLRSVNTFVRAVRSFFIWLVERRYLETNPAAHVKPVKEDYDDPRAISFNDFPITTAKRERSP